MIKWIVLVSCIFGSANVPALEHVELPSAPAYVDVDPSARVFRAPAGRAVDFRRTLNRAIQVDPRNALALSHRAYLYLRTDNIEEALRDFDRAMAVTDQGGPLHRQVLWAYGWALYDLGRIDEALKTWQLNADLHGGKPFWVPYTFALAYWTAGEREAALAWYSTAVRSNEMWGELTGFEKKTKHWRPRQKVKQRELFDAWIAQEALHAPVSAD